MLDALRVLWRAVLKFEDYNWLFISANVISVLLSFPIITAPAAFAGLSRLSHTAMLGPTAAFSDFWSGFRFHFLRGIIVGTANVVIIGIFWSNLTAYSARTDILFTILRAMWIIVLVVWLTLQFYLWPILEEMEIPTLRGGLRNAAVMMAQNPCFTLVLLFSVLIIVLISTALILPWFLLTNSMIACIANAAVINRLQLVRSHTPSV